MAYRTIQQEYMQIPPVTRAYTTACVLTTIAVVSQLHRNVITSVKFTENCTRESLFSVMIYFWINSLII